MWAERMSEVVIKAEGLGKRYRVGERERYLALRDLLARAVTAPFRRNGQRRSTDDLWALRDVSFDVQRGRSGRACRAQRRGEDHAAENPLANHDARRLAVPKFTAASAACSKSAPVFIPS